MIKFCKKCKIETERYTRGECKQCACRLAASYRASNRDKVLASHTLYYSLNKDKERYSRKKWRKENPEKYRIKNINKRARRRSAEGKLSQELEVKLLKLQKGLCPCCKQPLGDDYHLDHIMPIALGGSNTDDNIQLLRSMCNINKSAKHPVEFMQSRGFLL